MTASNALWHSLGSVAQRLSHSHAAGFTVQHRPSRVVIAALAALTTAICAGCGDLPTGAQTVDLGDNFEAPDRNLDADFFYCVIQPEVLGEYGCAAGGAGDSGGCHRERSALRLLEVAGEPRCDGDRLLGSPSLEAETNFMRVRASVGVDADASPLYRRPVGLDSHPRVIFQEGSDPAELIREWIDSGFSG